jgi:hypothetical protein
MDPDNNNSNELDSKNKLPDYSEIKMISSHDIRGKDRCVVVIGSSMMDMLTDAALEETVLEEPIKVLFFCPDEKTCKKAIKTYLAWHGYIHGGSNNTPFIVFHDEYRVALENGSRFETSHQEFIPENGLSDTDILVLYDTANIAFQKNTFPMDKCIDLFARKRVWCGVYPNGAIGQYVKKTYGKIMPDLAPMSKGSDKLDSIFGGCLDFKEFFIGAKEVIPNPLFDMLSKI